jgi:hypothetical protein
VQNICIKKRIILSHSERKSVLPKNSRATIAFLLAVRRGILQLLGAVVLRKRDRLVQSRFGADSRHIWDHHFSARCGYLPDRAHRESPLHTQVIITPHFFAPTAAVFLFPLCSRFAPPLLLYIFSRCTFYIEGSAWSVGCVRVFSFLQWERKMRWRNHICVFYGKWKCVFAQPFAILTFIIKIRVFAFIWLKVWGILKIAKSLI